jgi:hypothetical protein
MTLALQTVDRRRAFPPRMTELPGVFGMVLPLAVLRRRVVTIARV